MLSKIRKVTSYVDILQRCLFWFIRHSYIQSHLNANGTVNHWICLYIDCKINNIFKFLLEKIFWRNFMYCIVWPTGNFYSRHFFYQTIKNWLKNRDMWNALYIVCMCINTDLWKTKTLFSILKRYEYVPSSLFNIHITFWVIHFLRYVMFIVEIYKSCNNEYWKVLFQRVQWIRLKIGSIKLDRPNNIQDKRKVN